MALLPLKQNVIIKRESFEEDEWGDPIGVTVEIPMKCRLTEGTKLVRKTTTTGGVPGVSTQEVVSAAQIIFDKYADILISDKIIYKDEGGRVFNYSPLNIERTRGMNGKALLTTVHV